jgi:hypothetical protein
MNSNTERSRFDFGKLSDKQIECLGAIAFQGNHLAYSRVTHASLVRYGLIREVKTQEYEVADQATHMDFCQWCAEQANAMTESDVDWVI